MYYNAQIQQEIHAAADETRISDTKLVRFYF